MQVRSPATHWLAYDELGIEVLVETEASSSWNALLTVIGIRTAFCGFYTRWQTEGREGGGRKCEPDRGRRKNHVVSINPLPSSGGMDARVASSVCSVLQYDQIFSHKPMIATPNEKNYFNNITLVHSRRFYFYDGKTFSDPRVNSDSGAGGIRQELGWGRERVRHDGMK